MLKPKIYFAVCEDIVRLNDVSVDIVSEESGLKFDLYGESHTESIYQLVYSSSLTFQDLKKLENIR